MNNVLQEGINWAFGIYLKDPGKLIMDENSTAAATDWDIILQISAKTHEDAKKRIPENYKDWYIVKIEHPMDKNI